MRSGRKEEESHNHERWLVSYADFITLLFAFFVVMYSISSVNEGKYKVLSETLEGAFNVTERVLNPIKLGDHPSAPTESELSGQELPVERTLPVTVPRQSENNRSEGEDANGGETRSLKQMADRLYDLMQPWMDEGLVGINENEDWVEISVGNSLLFGSGEAVPVDQAFPLIDRVASVLKEYPNAVLVEGFTDNVPIKSSLHPSNWELSTARAAAVVRMLALEGVSQNRMAAIGYGEYQPIARNDTKAGRQRNRRVVLLIAKDSVVRHTLRK